MPKIFGIGVARKKYRQAMEFIGKHQRCGPWFVEPLNHGKMIRRCR